MTDFTYISQYLNDVIKEFKTGVAKEHSYRPALKNLFESVDKTKNITAINEPARGTFGAPDFMIKSGDTTIAFAEAKDIGVNRLDNLFDREIEQKHRYLDALPNLIYTDYLDFRFYRDGTQYAQVRIADFNGKNITPLPDNFQTLHDLLCDFYNAKTSTIKSPVKLAELMAAKARLIANVIKNALEAPSDNNSLYEQLESFRKILIRTMTDTEFADIYAQTIAYGMFVARLHDKTLGDFSRAEAATLIPKSVPFLRKMFDYIAGNDIDERIVWSVDSLAEIFSYTDVADILKDFGRKTKTTDPIVHFYETFLSKYDKSLRKMRGVYYTPQPVVDYIVRSVDEILKTDFELPNGLADKSKITKKIMIQGAPKPVEREFHRVQLLDPATGTGTFLATTINYIYDKFKNNAGIWPNYVENDLLPRLHGFEIMMSSYTMAHLKMDLVLRETGYIQGDARINEKIFRPDNLLDTNLANIGRNSAVLNTNNRMGIYLTNSLEQADPDTQTLWAAQWLSAEAKEANNIKQNIPVMCVLGNPPYSVSSANTNDFAKGLIEKYKTGLNEKKLNLDDDYIKFIALGQHYIDKNGNGILAYISNNSFLDGVTHRQMRHSLMETFDKIYIINLHGNARTHETSPDGTKDENVFDIMAGVSINIFVKTGNNKKLADVFYRDLYGKRDIKYDFLNEHNLQNSEFKALKPVEPYYFFAPKDFSNEKLYNNFPQITDIFITNNSGIKTDRDNLFIDFESTVLADRIQTLLCGNIPQQFADQYRVADSGSYKITQIIKNVSYSDNRMSQIMYRPFDVRYIYYDPIIISRPAATVMQHMLKPNMALVVARQFGGKKHFISFITNKLIEISSQPFAPYTVFPLYIYTNDDKTPNLNQQIVSEIESKVGQTTPESIFDYIYGVLHSPSYREKYREFLKIDFPRIPYPENADRFEHYRKYGEQLRKLHLMTDIPQSNVSFPIGGDCVVDKPKYENGRVYINKTQYFDNVPQIAWDLFIGGYQPAQKYLKDRRGRTLSMDEIIHYENIITVLHATDKIMKDLG
ncbi:MAG: N-6 DNA methylase [Alphaproteobacteria bacterium]|nr:N-6 DNA methylase [Alphaproteobacteria bacterium]